MADAREWAALARTWLRTASPRVARAMREREQEAARRRWEDRRGKRADEDAREPVRARWATEPEPEAGPSEEEIEAAKEALARDVALERARDRARRDRAGRSD